MDKPDVHVRLYKTPRRVPKPEKTANDAVISDLPGDTLRWIKNHRRLGCDSKMVLSLNRERQLRDIFNGIDVGKHGAINLTELSEAVSFVSERLKKRIGTFKGFDKIIDIFRAMDDNGDGNVDFREFTNAMSGSSQSALDKASEQDIANLHRCFLEFGVIKARRHAIAKINEYTGLSFAGEKAFKSAATHEDSDHHHHQHQGKLRKSQSGVVIDDLKSYQLFRTLFEEKRDVSQDFTPVSTENPAQPEGTDDSPEKLTPNELLLKEFQAENKRLNMAGLNDPAKEAELEELHERLKQARLREQALLARDPDALAMQVQQMEALKYFAERRRKMRPMRRTNPLFVTVDGKPIVNSLHTTTALPCPGRDTAKELRMRQEAQKEAFDIIRSLRYLSPLEKDRRMREFTQSGQNSRLPPPIDIPSGSDKSGALSSPALTPLHTPQSSLECTRFSSNLPTSRKHARHVAAVQHARTFGASLCLDRDGDGDGGRPRTAPAAQTVTVVTSKPVEASPQIACIPPGGFSAKVRSRPSTANNGIHRSFSAGGGFHGTALTTDQTPRMRPQSSHAATHSQRLRLRSPKQMVSGRLR